MILLLLEHVKWSWELTIGHSPLPRRRQREVDINSPSRNSNKISRIRTPCRKPSRNLSLSYTLTDRYRSSYIYRKWKAHRMTVAVVMVKKVVGGGGEKDIGGPYERTKKKKSLNSDVTTVNRPTFFHETKPQPPSDPTIHLTRRTCKLAQEWGKVIHRHNYACVFLTSIPPHPHQPSNRPLEHLINSVFILYKFLF